MAANLPQPCEGGQHVHLALVETLFGDGLHDLVAAAAQFGQVQFPLIVAERTVTAFFNPVRQIFRHVLLKAA
jgi:hypothetical protein